MLLLTAVPFEDHLHGFFRLVQLLRPRDIGNEDTFERLLARGIEMKAILERRYDVTPADVSNASFARATPGIARTADPNSANSQFFINYVPTPHLDGQYTIVGQVVEGMEHVDALAKGEPPRNPDKIVRMRVAADDDQPQG